MPYIKRCVNGIRLNTPNAMRQAEAILRGNLIVVQLIGWHESCSRIFIGIVIAEGEELV